MKKKIIELAASTATIALVVAMVWMFLMALDKAAMMAAGIGIH